jgi:hypothetical protein
MAEPALAALYRALFTQLSTGGTVAADRWFPDMVPPGVDKPYGLFWFISGGESQRVRRSEAEFVIGVKVVSPDMAVAMQGAGEVAALLDGKGKQEVTGGYLDAGPDWIVVNSSIGLAIHVPERFAGKDEIYHEGSQFSIRMERA